MSCALVLFGGVSEARVTTDSAAKNSAMLNGRPIDRSLKTPRPRHSASEDPRRDHQGIRAAQSKFFRRSSISLSTK